MYYQSECGTKHFYQNLFMNKASVHYELIGMKTKAMHRFDQAMTLVL